MTRSLKKLGPKRTPIKVLRALRSEDASVCRKCADLNGATWPKGHCASQWSGTCFVCKEAVCVCAMSDWDWPWERPGTTPEDREL